MATNARRALMRHLGLKLVEHADVDVRELIDPWNNRPAGKVAILRNPTGYVWLGNPDSLENTYRFLKRPDGTIAPDYHNEVTNYFGAAPQAYADLPLRIEGLFLISSGEVRLYEVDKNFGGQYYWSLTGSRVRRNEVATSGDFRAINLTAQTRIKLRDVPRAQRHRVLWNYAQMLLEGPDHTKYDDIARGLQVRLAMAGYDASLGRVVTPDHNLVQGYRTRAGLAVVHKVEYLQLRQDLKAMGQMIASPDTTPEQFVEELHDFTDTVHGAYFKNQMVNAWSKLHPDDGLVNCRCGHLEADEHVVYGRGGRTICRACIENGVYHFIEDLQEYDAGGYQHEDGLWYSYEEGDDDSGDDDFTPGVRSYSVDVRSYLAMDKTIKPSSYGEFLMGIELEVVPYGSRNDAADHTLHTLAPGYAILKNDGSLDDGGFEIVTAPRGLKEHITRFSDWKPYSSLRAWDAGCCGMHVHISSQAFTPTTLGKFIEFINSTKNDDFIRSIAGRHCRFDEQAAHYCQRDGCKPGNPKATLDSKDNSRYFMVNTNNITRNEAQRLGLNPDEHAIGRSQNTIELRIFRASLKKARLLAQIEFAHAAVMFCRWSSMRELDEQHFLKWLKGMAGLYPNLAKWFGVRANTEVVEAKPQARVGADV